MTFFGFGLNDTQRAKLASRDADRAAGIQRAQIAANSGVTRANIGAGASGYAANLGYQSDINRNRTQRYGIDTRARTANNLLDFQRSQIPDQSSLFDANYTDYLYNGIDGYREHGGPTEEGKRYIVNENGQETFMDNNGNMAPIPGRGARLFNPPADGTVIPAGGGRNARNIPMQGLPMPESNMTRPTRKSRRESFVPSEGISLPTSGFTGMHGRNAMNMPDTTSQGMPKGMPEQAPNPMQWLSPETKQSMALYDKMLENDKKYGTHLGVDTSKKGYINPGAEEWLNQPTYYDKLRKASLAYPNHAGIQNELARIERSQSGNLDRDKFEYLKAQEAQSQLSNEQLQEHDLRAIAKLNEPKVDKDSNEYRSAMAWAQVRKLLNNGDF